MAKIMWDDLPGDVALKVLAYLPPGSCLRFRAVCKSWRDMIDSEEFMNVSRQMWMAKPFMITFQRVKIVESVSIYDPPGKRWYRLSLSFLPVPVCGRAAHGSLLCVEAEGKEFVGALYVCDPLAKTFFKLPPMEETHKKSISVTLKVDPSAYKVYVGYNNQLQVYDSRRSSWESLGGSPMVWSSTKPSVLCKNSFFALSTIPGVLPGFGVRYKLLKFNLDDRVWRVVDVEMPYPVVSPYLAENGGRIVMVGIGYKRMIRRIQIWELNENDNIWDEMTHVPPMFCPERVAGLWNISCAWSGEWICIASQDRVLSYNLRTKTWVLSPPNSGAVDNRQLNLINSFKPSFAWASCSRKKSQFRDLAYI